jgi:hypothetical protein
MPLGWAMAEDKKLFGEKTLSEAVQAARHGRRIPHEMLFGVLGIGLTIGGWVWYASRLTTQTQVKSIVAEQLKQCTPRTRYIQLKTRVDLTERQSAEWRKEIKQSLSEIKKSLKNLSLRLHRTPNQTGRRR